MSLKKSLSEHLLKNDETLGLTKDMADELSDEFLNFLSGNFNDKFESHISMYQDGSRESDVHTFRSIDDIVNYLFEVKGNIKNNKRID